MKSIQPTAAIFTFMLALPADAAQFAVQLDAPYDGANAQLMHTLKVTEIARVSEGGAHYIVLDAPNDAFVEAFVLAIGREAIGLHALEANWENPVMETLPMSQRLRFLKAIACEFCSS